MCSDAVAQSLSRDEGRPWDVPRTLWIAVWGSAISGLMLQHWFTFLSWLFPMAVTNNAHLAGKVFVNQLVMSPGLNAGFFTFVIFTRDAPVLRMPRHKRIALASKLRVDLPKTILRSCCFWVCVQPLNFRFLPPRWAVVVSNVAFLVWNTYLSTIGHVMRS